MSVLYWIFRIILGVLITGAGVGKLLDVRGFVSIIKTYQLSLPMWLMWIIAIGIIVFEVVLGLWILFGNNLKTPAILSIMMHSGYFILLTTSLLRGLNLQNCGCFGVFLARPLTWYSPLEDIVLVIVSYGLFILAK